MLSEKGLLAKVAPETLAAVPAQDSGSAGDWVGVFARENVLAYNTGMIQEAALPASLLDLAKPEWKGKVAIAPTDADFLPLIGAVAAMKGRPAALEWLKGLRENAMIFDDDEGVVAAVDRGAVGDRHRQQLLLGAAAHGKRRRQDEERAFIILPAATSAADERLRRRGAEELRTTRRRRRSFSRSWSANPTQEMVSKLDITFEYPLRRGRRGEPDAEAERANCRRRP